MVFWWCFEALGPSNGCGTPSRTSSVGTLSQVRTGSDVSHPWVDSGVARGRVLSHLQSLGEQSCSYHLSDVRLSSFSDFRLSNQLFSDDLVILQESAGTRRSQSLGSAVALLLLRHWTREVSGRHFRSPPSCSHLRSVPPRRPSACRH